MTLRDTLKNLQDDTTERDLYSRLEFSLKEIAGRVKEQMISEFQNSIPQIIKDEISKIKVRDGRDGLNGKGIDGQNGQDGKDGINADENKIIEEIMKKLPPISMRSGGKGGGGDTIIAEDLSSQCNGSTYTFTTTKRIGKSLLVVSSQFPNVLRLTTDFTASNQTLTLSSSLTPIQSGQTLYFMFAEG